MKSLSIKKSLTIIAFGIVASSFMVFTGCVKQKFDVPPPYIPSSGLKATLSIDALKKWYKDHGSPDMLKLDSIIIAPDTIFDPIIEGIISANDESGNIYKSVYLQDSTGGISVSLDRTGLYTTYPVGQKIFIKCRELYMGNYGTAVQLGYLYNGTTGRIPDAVIPLHLFPDGAPGSQPKPVEFNIAHLPDLSKITSLLVAINSVTFPEKGQPFVKSPDSYTSRKVADSANRVSSIIIYTSKYANFKGTLLPAGIGTLQGILTIFGTKYELLVRDSLDLINFHPLK